MHMNKKKKTKKTNPVRVIAVYFLCLLAAFCTWLGVMYAEQSGEEGKKGQQDEGVQVVCSYDLWEDRNYISL